MLSLTSSDIPLVYQNPLAKLVTSLPYLDSEPDDMIKQKVDRLIRSEMLAMEKIDYLSSLPMPSTSVFDKDLIKNEIQRVKDHCLLEDPEATVLPSIDISNADINQLKQFNEKANLISQYNGLRQMNLELMLKFGPDAHKIFIEFQNNYKNELSEQNGKLRVKIDEINSKRKFEQSSANDKFSNYQYKIGNLLRKNEEIELDCLRLEAEILRMRKKQLKLQ